MSDRDTDSPTPPPMPTQSGMGMPEPRYFDNDGYICARGVKPRFVLKEDYDTLRGHLAAALKERDEAASERRRLAELNVQYVNAASAECFRAESAERRADSAERALGEARAQNEGDAKDARRYRAKREMDYEEWLEMVSSVHRGPAQSREEWLAGYDAEMDDYLSAIDDAALSGAKGDGGDKS